jgi:hypothetical protein
MTPWDENQLDAFTASVDGHVPALWTIWSDWGSGNAAFPGLIADKVAARGAVPIIWWQPVVTGDQTDTPFSNQRIVAGNYDAYIHQWARDAKAHGGPVIVRFAHEMDGDWFPWGVGRAGNTAANFIAAWRHIWNIFHGPSGEGATNVRFLWSPYKPKASLYPGPEYVDYVGFTAFNWASGKLQSWRTMTKVLSGQVKAAKPFKKPIIIPELGSAPDERGGTKSAWITAGYPAAFKKFRQVVAIVYFNVDSSPGQPDWRLNSPAGGLNAYRQILAKRQFQGKMFPPSSAPGAPRNVTAVAGNGQASVLWLAPTSNGGSPITSYTATSSPGSRTCTTAALTCVVNGLTNGVAYTFTVRASNSSGAGPPSSPSARVTPGISVDHDPPVVQPLSAELGAAEALDASVTMHVAWPAATDASGIIRYELEVRKGNGAWAQVALASLTATGADVPIAVKKAHTFRVRAVDGANNVGPWTTARPGKLKLTQETPNGKLAYAGSFKRETLGGSSGGQVQYATAGGSVAKLTFTGSSVAFVTTRSQARGIAEIWLDRVKVATIDLYSVTLRTADIAWAKHVATGKHTLEVRIGGAKNAASTSTRVDIDAFLVWR